MILTVEAIDQNRVFKPLQSLGLPENTPILLTITTSKTSKAPAAKTPAQSPAEILAEIAALPPGEMTPCK